MEKIINKYEAVLVFSLAEGSEDSAKALLARFTGLIEENGTLDKVDEWGKRRLAYPINDEPEGYYALVEFSSVSEFPAELDRVFKITEGALRAMIIRKDVVA